MSYPFDWDDNGPCAAELHEDRLVREALARTQPKTDPEVALRAEAIERGLNPETASLIGYVELADYINANGGDIPF